MIRHDLSIGELSVAMLSASVKPLRELSQLGQITRTELGEKIERFGPEIVPIGVN